MKIRPEIKVGTVILLAIALLYFGLNYLKGTNIFSTTSYYYAVYDGIDGLGVDNAVKLNGYKVGRVAQLTLLPERGNKILVKIEITQEGMRVPYNSDAVIINSDLLGTKAIAFEFSDTTLLHEYGDTLHGSVEMEIQKIVEQKLAPIQKKIEDLVSETNALIQQVKSTVGAVESTIDTAKFAIGTINSAVYNIDTAFSTAANSFNRVAYNIEGITANLRNNNDKINDILENLATISDSLTRAQYASAIENASRALAQVDSMITKVNNGEGSLGLLLNDDALYRNLEEASLEIDKLTEDMRINPKRYVHFSVFGRKEKEEDKPEPKPRTDQ